MKYTRNTTRSFIGPPQCPACPGYFPYVTKTVIISNWDVLVEQEYVVHVNVSEINLRMLYEELFQRSISKVLNKSMQTLLRRKEGIMSKSTNLDDSDEM